MLYTNGIFAGYCDFCRTFRFSLKSEFNRISSQNPCVFLILICFICFQAIHLKWGILSRDCIIYIISVSCLVVIMWDGTVSWYEATVLLMLFAGYFSILFFSRKITRLFSRFFNKRKLSEEKSKFLKKKRINHF